MFWTSWLVDLFSLTSTRKRRARETSLLLGGFKPSDSTGMINSRRAEFAQMYRPFVVLDDRFPRRVDARFQELASHCWTSKQTKALSSSHNAILFSLQLWLHEKTGQHNLRLSACRVSFTELKHQDATEAEITVTSGETVHQLLETA